MMVKRNSDEILKTLIFFLKQNLKELSKYKDRLDEQFQYGEKTAYTECLEVIQDWEKAKSNQLNFEIEKRFPL